MKTNWDLTVFYKDFDDPAFKADLGGLDASIAALTEAVAAPCEDEAAKLTAQGYRVTVDTRSEKIGKKIRDAQMEKIPYMLVVGDRDIEAGTVSPRHRADGDLGAMTLDAFTAVLKDVVDNKLQK